MVRFFCKKIKPENRNFETWKKITEQTFQHICGENLLENDKVFVCPVYQCVGKNFLEQISSEKIEIFKKMYFEKFLAESFWKKFRNTGNTSVIESFHAKSFSLFVRKNVPINIRTRCTEARFAVSCLHHNENLSGYIEIMNGQTDMSDWPISEFSSLKLIKLDSDKKSKSTARFYEKKTIKYTRIKNQRQNSSALNSSEGLYKPHKLAKLIKVEKID